MKLREKTNSEICRENNLKYNYLTNIVEETSTKNQIRATLEIIAKTIIGTLGPYGSTTLIQDREQKHLVSKDGYDLINRMSFDNDVARTVLQFVKQISSNQVLSVGDGSTSAIVVANALYSALTNPEHAEKFKKIAAKDIVDILNDIAEFVEEDLKKIAMPIDEKMDKLEKIAAVAVNNDAETGKFMADVYRKVGKYGFVSTDVLNKTDKDMVEIKQGIEWGRGYQDPIYARGYENEKIIYEKSPKMILFNSELTYDDLQMIMMPLMKEALNQEGAELLIVANGYTDDVYNFFKMNRTKHLMGKSTEMIFTPVDIDQVTDRSRHDLEDLATLAGCDIFDKFKIGTAEIVVNPKRFIGTAEKVIITKKNTQVIFDPEIKSKEKDKKVEALNKKLKKLLDIENPSRDEDFDIFETRRRISNMTNSNAIIHVGGKTLSERMSRERLIEDAIYACKSALEHGYIVGGNLAVPRSLMQSRTYLAKVLSKKYDYLPIERKNNFFLYFIDMLKVAFLESYGNVLNNSYFTEEDTAKTIARCMEENLFFNLKTHKFERADQTNIINSLQTDVEIMKSTISIVSLLSTSNQIITLNLNAMEEVTPKQPQVLHD